MVVKYLRVTPPTAAFVLSTFLIFSAILGTYLKQHPKVLARSQDFRIWINFTHFYIDQLRTQTFDFPVINEMIRCGKQIYLAAFANVFLYRNFWYLFNGSNFWLSYTTSGSVKGLWLANWSTFRISSMCKWETRNFVTKLLPSLGSW